MSSPAVLTVPSAVEADAESVAVFVPAAVLAAAWWMDSVGWSRVNAAVGAGVLVAAAQYIGATSSSDPGVFAAVVYVDAGAAIVVFAVDPAGYQVSMCDPAVAEVEGA